MIRSRFLVVVSALACMMTLFGGAAIAKQPAASTGVSFSANPVGLKPGVDVTVTAVTTAPSATTAAIDDGRLILQMATDGAAHPVPSARVVKWLALNPPGQKPVGGVTTVPLDLDRLGVGPGMTMGFRSQYVPGTGNNKVGAHTSAPRDLTTSVDPAAAVARIEVNPSTALLTSMGDRRLLTATAFDAAGNPLSASFEWSTSRPTTVGVTADGWISGVGFGSAQVTAAVGQIRSAPVLVVVASPAPGAIVVSDEQIVGRPEPIVEGPEAPADTYRARIRMTPNINDVLVSTGTTSLEGRVIEIVNNVDGTTTVTLRVLPLPDVFPNLRLDEQIDLSQAPIVFPAGTTDTYDITRAGNTFDFTPKAGAVTRRSSQLADLSPNALDAPVATSTFSLGIFEECESSTPLNTLPIQLSATPAVSFTVNPSLDLVWNDAVHRLVVSAEPKVTASVGVTATAAFEAKISCKHKAFEYQVLAPGALGVLLGGVVPVGFGFEISGKVTVASLGLGVSGFVKANAQLGFNCAAVNCEFVRSLGNFDKGWSVTTNGVSLSDVRLEPSLELFGYLKFEAGNPFIEFLRFDAIGAKVGLKLGGSFATRLGQISDATYASDYKLTLEGSAKAGTKLGEWLTALGLPSIAALELKITVNLATSPTGKLTADRAAYASGDAVRVRAGLDNANLTFLGIYNVEKLVLVRYFGGATTELATQIASAGQHDFDFNFNAPAAISADQLYVMVVTKILPLSLFELEVAKAEPILVTVQPPSVTLASGATQQFSAIVTGTPNTAVTWSASCGSISSSGLFTAPSTGSTCAVMAASADMPTAIGAAVVSLDESLTVSPSSVTLAPSGTQQFTARVNGTPSTAVTWTASCGTITTTGLYTAPTSGGPCTITATSTVNTNVVGAASVTVGVPAMTAGLYSLGVSGQNDYYLFVNRDDIHVESCFNKLTGVPGGAPPASFSLHDCQIELDVSMEQPSTDTVTLGVTGGGSFECVWNENGTGLDLNSYATASLGFNLFFTRPGTLTFDLVGPMPGYLFHRNGQTGQQFLIWGDSNPSHAELVITSPDFFATPEVEAFNFSGDYWCETGPGTTTLTMTFTPAP